MMKSIYLLVSHGTKDAEGKKSFELLLKRFEEAFPARKVQGCFLEMQEPSLSKAMDKCLIQGAQEIFILPLMFFPGRHVKEDIPKIIEQAKGKYPQVDFHLSSPLGEHALLIKILDQKIKEMHRHARRSS